MSKSFRDDLVQAAEHLKSVDPILAEVIDRAGLPDFKPHDDYYGSLVSSIIGQQLSVKAAATIKGRFKDIFGGKLPTPEQILQTDFDTMRAAGLSGQKVNYVKDLAQHVLDGKVSFEKLDSQSNEEIISELTDVKGVGVWTVHMFLMFCMGRLDVLATGDLGIRNGVGKLYGFESVPTPEEVAIIAKKSNWAPYQTVACWYIWRSLDNEPS